MNGNNDLTQYDLQYMFDFYRANYNVALIFKNQSATKQKSVLKMVTLRLLEYVPENSDLIRVTEHGKEIMAKVIDTWIEAGHKP